jgi:phosphatidylserine decarboxylase
VWNRSQRRLESEKIYGEIFIRWIYGSTPGKHVTDAVFSKSLFSRLYGSYQDTSLSARKIPGFIRTFELKMDEFEQVQYRSFNDFFIRKFKPGVRTFASDLREFPAFAEGRYLAFERIKEDQTFPVKGHGLSAGALLGNTELAKPFVGGPAFIARLCPTDYHRFHYPDAGQMIENYLVHGDLHSVNPIALLADSEIFISNERHISILETQNFGRLAYVEVGALCVGKIVQTHDSSAPFVRGEEKGYFLFGGSTVIVLGESGAWRPDQDILEKTQNHLECFVRLGERIGTKP